MIITVLDGRMMDTRENVHAYLSRELRFPEYYGGNLDALADCLGDLPRGGVVILTNYTDMKISLGDYADMIVSVFADISERTGAYTFTVARE